MNVTVLDGGFASQLTNHVGQVDGDPLWSARYLKTDPVAITKVHLEFLKAGADVVTTSTYQASISGFKEHLGLSESESIELMQSAVNLARRACVQFQQEAASHAGRKNPLVAGSIGPYGAFLHDCSEYTGSYVDSISEEQLIEWHRPRMKALVEAGADLLALETIPAQMEGEALVKLLREFPQQKAWLSFSCKDEIHTSHGEVLKDALRKCWQLNPSQLVAVGINCVNPQYVTALLGSVNGDGEDKIPLIVYPNSGETYNLNEGGWIGQELCKPLESYVPEWLNLNVSFIGGCCRVYPNSIAKMRSVVDNCLSK